MAESKTRASRVAAINDEFRRAIGVTRPGTAAPGRCFITAGVAALRLEAQIEILERVRNFADFKPADDPRGEHDFGSFRRGEGEHGEQVFWKIDCYADADMELGAEDPSDPKRSFRTLTIMLAAEY
jgi:hypothetical protein